MLNTDIIQKIGEAFWSTEAQPAKVKGIICPVCGSGSGPKGTGLSTKDDGNHWSCFSKCAFKAASKFDIFSLKYGLGKVDANGHIKTFDIKADIKKGLEMYPYLDNNDYHKNTSNGKITISKPQTASNSSLQVTGNKNEEQDITKKNRAFIQACCNNVGATTYWQNRAISDEMIDKFNLGYDSYKRAVVIPIENSGEYRYIERRVCDEDIAKYGGKYYNIKGANSCLFNIEVLDEPENAVFITEGAIDAISLTQVGATAMALNSVSNKGKLVDYLRGKRIDVPLLICMDRDNAGNGAADYLEKELRSLGFTAMKCNPTPTDKDEDTGEYKYKDPNDALIAVPERLKANAVHSLDEWRIAIASQTSCRGYLKEILGYYKKKKTCYKTNISVLDDILGGGIYSGITFLGAISSLGKTTFLLQVADSIAKQCIDVLYFSLEMSRAELVAKSLSRISYQLWEENNHKTRLFTTRDIISKCDEFNKDDWNTLKECFTRYNEYSNHIWIYEGVNTISVTQVKEAVEAHIKVTKHKPIVMIDYAQILAPNNEREFYSDGKPKPSHNMTDKQKIDNDVVKLKQLSRDLDIPIVAISSFNRMNYNEPVNTASFKESGAIEYSSDTLIGMQFPFLNYQKSGDGMNAKWEKEDERKNRIRKEMQELEQMQRNGQPVEVEIKILKDRHDCRGAVEVELIAKYNLFREMPMGVVCQDNITPFDKRTDIPSTGNDISLFSDGDNTISKYLQMLRLEQPDEYPDEIMQKKLEQFTEAGRRSGIKIGEKLELGDDVFIKERHSFKGNPARWKTTKTGIIYLGE